MAHQQSPIAKKAGVNMSSKPIDKVPLQATREALWAKIRAFDRVFTCRELQMETCCTLSQASEYLKCLVAARIVKVVGETGGHGCIRPTKQYRLERDCGVEAPRVRRDGTKVTQGIGREQLWETMRSLEVFTARDLHIFASTDEHSVAEGEAKTYCRLLAKAGYLRRSGDRYLLLRRTGPKPPMIQRTKQVYDPNLKQVVWREGEPNDK